MASEAEYLGQVNPNAFYEPVDIEAIKARSPKALVATEKRWVEKPNLVPSPNHYKLDHQWVEKSPPRQLFEKAKKVLFMEKLAKSKAGIPGPSSYEWSEAQDHTTRGLSPFYYPHK